MTELERLEQALASLEITQDEARKQAQRAYKYISIAKRRFPLLHDEILREVNER